MKEEVGEDAWRNGRYDEAVGIFDDLCTRSEFADFLIQVAYERI